MLTHLPSARKLTRLNRRQRKKLRAGEFQELAFEVEIRFNQALDEAAFDKFLDNFIEFIESRHLLIAGLGGRLPLQETDGIISTQGRGSATDNDKNAVRDWLIQRPEVANADTGAFVDGWYSYS